MIVVGIKLDEWNEGPRRRDGNLERLQSSEMQMDVH